MLISKLRKYMEMMSAVAGITIITPIFYDMTVRNPRLRESQRNRLELQETQNLVDLTAAKAAGEDNILSYKEKIGLARELGYGMFIDETEHLRITAETTGVIIRNGEHEFTVSKEAMRRYLKE